MSPRNTSSSSTSPKGAPPAAMRAQAARWLSKQAISAGRSPQSGAAAPAASAAGSRPSTASIRSSARPRSAAMRAIEAQRSGARARLMTWPITPVPP